VWREKEGEGYGENDEHGAKRESGFVSPWTPKYTYQLLYSSQPGQLHSAQIQISMTEEGISTSPDKNDTQKK
jgi:hypothetical protein